MPRHAASHPWKRQRFGNGQAKAQLCIEIVEHATDKVERKLGPYASESLRDRADAGLQQNLDHERFFTRFAT